MRKPTDTDIAAAEQRLQEIRSKVAEIRLICSGTLSHQTKKCGKSNCACASDPAFRHGPYYVWSRREKARQVNTTLPAELGPRFEEAVENYRKLRRLLRDWERASARAMVAAIGEKSRNNKKLRTRSGRSCRRETRAKGASDPG